MNSTIYRCGHCGAPTTREGERLSGEPLDRVVRLLREYGDHRTERVHGKRCRKEIEEHRREKERQHRRGMQAEAAERRRREW